MFSTSVQQGGSRPAYIYDNTDAISSSYELRIDGYVRELDDANSAEIVVYTVPSFVGHGIEKDGIEIQDRDMLANYIFNEVPLDGVKGIGKAGKDNGVLILLSLERDAGGGSMRIEVGRGLEGNITDGTAGEILDSFLVPAREEYESSGDKTAFDEAFLNTVVALGSLTGYKSENPDYEPPAIDYDDDFGPGVDQIFDYVMPGVFVGFIALVLILSIFGRRRRRRGYYSGYGGGWGGGSGGGGFGGGSGGGGGGSGGGGAGR